jgi:hypothetical protein
MSLPFPYSGPTAAISAGQSLSASFAVGPGELVGIIVPSGWTAANLTFQCSVDNVNFFELYDQFGAEITVTVPVLTGCMLAWDPSVKVGGYLKIRSGTVGSPVNQVSAANLTALIRKLMYSGYMGV